MRFRKPSCTLKGAIAQHPVRTADRDRCFPPGSKCRTAPACQLTMGTPFTLSGLHAFHAPPRLLLPQGGQSPLCQGDGTDFSSDGLTPCSVTSSCDKQNSIQTRKQSLLVSRAAGPGATQGSHLCRALRDCVRVCINASVCECVSMCVCISQSTVQSYTDLLS